MLSTSILYCNKLDDSLLERFDNASAATSEKGSKRRCSEQSAAKVVDPSAISVFSEPASIDLSLSRSRYRVRYLGCNTCDPRTHRLDSGIASYQKPLLDLYSTVLRRSVLLPTLYSSLSVINQVADFCNHGIVIAERDRFTASKHAQLPVAGTRPHSSASAASGQKASVETVVTKVITPLSNIVLWAAVKFQHRSSMKKVKNSAMKRRQIGVAFVPLSCSNAVLDKNAFLTLNSKQRFLLGLSHPALFVCVLQKVNSSQRLECHLFVCLNADDAIRMCSQMAELRQRASDIGKLHVPLAGQMGSYSYRSTPQPSSAASLISRSSNYAFSDLSSVTPKHNFSDIEEEDVSQQLSSLDSNTTSVTSSFAPNPVNGRMACDPRLFDPTRKLGQMRGHNQLICKDSLSWTELSSLSSAIISTKSEPNKSRIGLHAAQRDYRFQSYKCPENFVLPQLTNQVEKSNLASDNIKKSVAEPTIGVDKCTNKWSSVSEELQNNRLFAKASAKASVLESIEATPSYEPKISSHRVMSTNNGTQRFFGDTLRTVQAKISETKKLSGIIPREHLQTGNDRPKTQLTSNQFERKSEPIHTFDGKKEMQERTRALKSPNRCKEENNALKSTISNSIFFDNEEEGVKDDHRSTPDSTYKATFVPQDSRQPMNGQRTRNVVLTKSETEMGSHARARQRSEQNDPTVVLYLPEGSNVGVKCFNKSSSVNQWSTMASCNLASSTPTNDCQFCSIELNCEQCCNLCQSIEHQKRQSCPDCVLHHDDIALDESILQNFTNCHLITDRDKTHAGVLSVGQNGNSYQHDISMSNVPRVDAINSKLECRKTSLFGRIRELGSSIFGSRKALNRSRIWSRIRSNSQRLKGSKRFSKNKISAKEPLNRIFLPRPSKLIENENDKSNGQCRVYVEPYLSSPELNAKNASSRSRPNNAERCEQQLSEAIENVNLNGLGKKARDRCSDKPTDVSRTKLKLTRTSDQQQKTPHGPRNGVNPFFLSHPYKVHEGFQLQMELTSNEFSPNQVFSMSSDSGMEECDCHSSTENSPSGYPQTTAHRPNGQLDYDRCKEKMRAANAPPYLKSNGPASKDLVSSSQCQAKGRLSSAFGHKQSGHWSETNLQSELGYMP